MTSMSSGTSTSIKTRLIIFFHIPSSSWVSKFCQRPHYNPGAHSAHMNLILNVLSLPKHIQLSSPSVLPLLPPPLWIHCHRSVQTFIISKQNHHQVFSTTNRVVNLERRSNCALYSLKELKTFSHIQRKTHKLRNQQGARTSNLWKKKWLAKIWSKQFKKSYLKTKIHYSLLIKLARTFKKW